MTQQESPTIPPMLNRVMSTMLRSPLHFAVSRSIMLITFTGRKSGRRYTTPISYVREGDLITAFTHAKWWRNVAGGAPVTVRIKGKEYHGRADAVAEDKAAVTEALHNFLIEVRFDARYYNVTFDEGGEPNWDDVQRAAQEAVMLRIELDRAAA